MTKLSERSIAKLLEKEMNRALRGAMRNGMTKPQIHARMGTSMIQLNRILDPQKYNTTVGTLESFARAVGVDLEIRLIKRR